MIMWSNFFVQQDEEGRIKGARGQRRVHRMSDSQEGKIKLAFFVSIIGVTLTVLGMGTEFWVELAQSKNFSGNQTCQMAHYGLWKGCIRTLWVADIDPERTSCGPAELPGESNCTYFKFFTSGGECSVLVLFSVLVFHRSVLALLSSDHSVTLHHELSWSVACVGSAGGILILGGFLFMLLSLPFSPWQKCFPHKNGAT
uniref:Calcium channel, voltage-dependent, gamma subunit 6b n=1 Tax=Labrus bergylta TaxID=56723 RepID=A0A3Q3MLE4_9LABR